MKRFNVSLMALVVLAIAALALTGCSGRRAVISVNGEKVTKNDFYNRLQTVPVQTPQGPQMAGRYVMQQIISEKLVQQLAQDDKVEPTEGQISKKINLIKKESGNLSKALQQRGMTLDDLKRQLKVQQAMINVVTKGITISDEQAKQAYDQARKATPSPFVRPEARMMSGIIVSKKPDIDKAYSLLNSGTDFSTVAMQYNDDPNIKQNQGKLRPVTLGKEDPLPQSIKSMAFSLQIGKYSKPFLVDGKWVILKADNKRPERITKFDEVKDTIKEQLAVAEGTKKGTFRKEMQAFAKKANIKVNHPAYKDIPEQIKKEASQNLPTPAATGTPAAQPAAPK